MKIRGVWLTNVDSQILNSKQHLTEAIQFLANTGFNTIFPVVWNKGFTLYCSQVMKDNFGVDFEIDPKYQQQDRDPLLEVVEAARTVKLKVIPWFEYGFAYSHEILKDQRKQQFQKNLYDKGWIAYDQHQKPLKKNGFEWLNALDPEVQNFILDLMLEVVENYDVDGIQGDDRVPAFPSEGGYDQKTKQQFCQKFGEEPPLNTKDKVWLQWRADRLTDFLAQLYQKIKAINPNLIMSIAPHPFKFGFQEYLQDCPTWLKLGLVDIIHPQLYRRNLKDYKTLAKEIMNQLTADQLSKLSPGILIKVGNFRISANDLWKIIEYNRQSGIQGEVFFFYEGLRANNSELAKVLHKNNYCEASTIFKEQGLYD
ncbi:MAG: family 10 glycosylhydrolase [Symploca sp. SIO1C4]|uniref:Family 10 glycosylhydrolase n=1 Tax=Symploca sp. SIO1C4 TaxID=2607765 RepID=A0A6B3NFK5_9CYAN|nr:family 10 glycosylhydrolase [Symploca sp. SIO1C4]NET04525.1 family 10 glycosylhydrolase [Symploca sp. SIO2B6]